MVLQWVIFNCFLFYFVLLASVLPSFFSPFSSKYTRHGWDMSSKHEEHAHSGDTQIPPHQPQASVTISTTLRPNSSTESSLRAPHTAAQTGQSTILAIIFTCSWIDGISGVEYGRKVVAFCWPTFFRNSRSMVYKYTRWTLQVRLLHRLVENIVPRRVEGLQYLVLRTTVILRQGVNITFGFPYSSNKVTDVVVVSGEPSSRDPAPKRWRLD